MKNSDSPYGNDKSLGHGNIHRFSLSHAIVVVVALVLLVSLALTASTYALTLLALVVGLTAVIATLGYGVDRYRWSQWRREVQDMYARDIENQ